MNSFKLFLILFFIKLKIVKKRKNMGPFGPQSADLRTQTRVTRLMRRRMNESEMILDTYRTQTHIQLLTMFVVVSHFL